MLKYSDDICAKTQLARFGRTSVTSQQKSTDFVDTPPTQMTKKTDDNASSTRVRDNQRRSRMRRAERLDELQQRIRDYEQKGVTATLEMQNAARKVAQDNARLRALLTLKGVSNEEVELWLQNSDGHSAAVPYHPLAPIAPRPVASETNATEQLSHAMRQQLYHERNENRALFPVDDPLNQESNATSVTTELLRIENPIYEGISKQEDARYCQSHNDRLYSAMETSDCPTTFDCFCPPSADVSRPSVDAGLEISCETAAAIIAGIRVNSDRDSIRASLGCRDQGPCTIKNSVVMQLMDEI